jgi:serine/threonine protein kinase/tetratricopeptide (TPR) repeat protein
VCPELDITESFEMLPPGTGIAHYVIEGTLGAGGMGTVYLARDTALDRKVALKVLPRRFYRDPDVRRRFTQEAQMVARLNHPNIVTVFEVGEHGERPFIGMEYVEGRSLADFRATSHPSLEQTLELAIQITEGLIEAHVRGIVHQDVKPSNIMVNNRGSVKILDFGLARFRDTQSLSRSSIQGTVQYMSPEQLRGESVDERSDLFSMGILLYEMLTGVNPFRRADMAATIAAIRESEPPPMNEVAPGTPVELQQIVMKLLARDPPARYQRAEDVRSDLRYAREAVLSGRIVLGPQARDFSRSIAVLPFANLSPDPEQSYFCEGMAEDIINALTRVEGLRVAARVSSFAFKDATESAREIGRKLHVDTLLEGSVRRSADHLRIAVQLIDVTTGYHLWSEQYDKTLTDVFAIQDEITRSVIAALRLLLTEPHGEAPRTATTNPRAYDLYLKGRQYYNQGRRSTVRFALQMFTKAAELDGTYAQAFVGIADCCALLLHFYGESTDVHLAQADAASRRALELNPGLPQAHASRGFTLWLMGRLEEAWREFDLALSMDPHQPDVLYICGRARFQSGELAQAAALFERACKEREHHEARYFAAQTHTALGEPEAALAAYRLAFRAIEQHVELNPDDARAYTMAAVSLCRLGEREPGLEWIERALSIDPTDAGIQYNAACLFALEGQPTRAIECLEAAARSGFAHRDWVDKDPDLDSLRSDPRFAAIRWRDSGPAADATQS